MGYAKPKRDFGFAMTASKLSQDKLSGTERQA